MPLKYLKTFRWVAVLIILAFLARVLVRSWDSLAAANLRWDPSLLVVALALLIVLQNMSMIGWVLIVRAMGMSLPWRRGFAVFHQSQVARFVPGSIWHVVGRTYMTASDGLSSPLVFCSMVFENTLILVAAMLVFTVSLPFWGVVVPGNATHYLVLAPVLAALVYPPLLSRLLNFGLRLIRKSPVSVDISYRSVLGVALYQTLVRIVGGTCLFLIIMSVYPQPLARMPAIIGMHSIAYVIGFLSFIAPAGLGVREAAIAYLLSLYIPLPAAVVVAVLARFMWMLSESINAGMAVLVNRSGSKSLEASGARVPVGRVEAPANEP